MRMADGGLVVDVVVHILSFLKAQRPTASVSTLNTLTNKEFDSIAISDPRTEIPGMIGVAEWLEDYIERHLSFQQTTPLWIKSRRHPELSPASDNNVLGCFRLADPTLPPDSPLQFDMEGQHWSSGTIGFTYGHYMHILSDYHIRMIRNMSVPTKHTCTQQTHTQAQDTQPRV